MRLTVRDAFGTLLVGCAVAVTLSVVDGWNWPLIGDARAGVIALFVLSYPSCLTARAPQRIARAIQRREGWGPFVIAATALGASALLLMLANLILNSTAVLTAATAVVVAIWIVATAHHLTEPADTTFGPVVNMIPF